VKTFHEEDDVMHLIADDTAFQLARDRRQRLLLALMVERHVHQQDDP